MNNLKLNRIAPYTKILLSTILVLSGISGIAQNTQEYNANNLIELADNLVYPKESRNEQFIIGILGQENEVKTALTQLATQNQINGQEIVIKSYKKVDDVELCQIIYVPNIPENHKIHLEWLQNKLKSLGNKHTSLIVTEKGGLAQHGAAISFLPQSNSRKKFEVNKALLKQMDVRMKLVFQPGIINVDQLYSAEIPLADKGKTIVSDVDDSQKNQIKPDFGLAEAVFEAAENLQWPPSYEYGDFIISVFGSGTDYIGLHYMASSRKINNQQVVVNNINSIEEMARSHIVFISKNHLTKIEQLVLHQSSRPTVWITNHTTTLYKGIHLNIIQNNDKYSYQIDETALTQSFINYTSFFKQNLHTTK